MLFHLYNNPVGSHYPTFLNEKPGAPKSDKLFRVDGWLVVAEQALTVTSWKPQIIAYLIQGHSITPIK